MLNVMNGQRLCIPRGLRLAVVVLCLLSFSFGVRANVSPVADTVSRPQAAVAAPVLDDKRVFALGMIETGNNDYEVGGAGEISRYQILPAVWKIYSCSRDYFNPEVSLQVARSHWTFLANSFRERTGRTPDDFDMYVLWNTGCGYYAKKGFNPHRIAPSVQDRAQRFVNLVNRKG